MQIMTRNGFKKISEIKVGDEVLSKDEKSNTTGFKKVKEVYILDTNIIMHIITNNNIDIKTTQNHPFWVINKGWTLSCDIDINDKLIDDYNNEYMIKSIYLEKLSDNIKVYNIEVEDWHTYFISSIKIWVHNASLCKP